MPGHALFDYGPLLAELERRPALAPLRALVPVDLMREVRHGDFPRWLAALLALPDLVPESVELAAALRIGEVGQLDATGREALHATLQALHPWRKGPLQFFGVDIDTEWRSDWKWDRVLPHLSPLEGRTVLDVGCGNGYHCWRMAGAGAALVIGIDPMLLYTLQYWALRRYLPDVPVHVLPQGLEALPGNLQAFDTVFSMGVFYHRRSPFDHLLELRSCLRPGGELVLETLVVDGSDGLALVPRGRYARMPNVWFLPTSNTMLAWLEKSGYTSVSVVDSTVTSIAEQRSTPWMRFESLAESLDPQDPGRTIEGYPAPERAVFLARRP